MSYYNPVYFRFNGFIGRGRKSVMKVKHILTNQEFALKKIQTNDYNNYLDVIQELIFLKKCSHPNIIKLVGFHITKESINLQEKYQISILMDLMKCNLSENLIKRRKENPPHYYLFDEIKKIMEKLVEIFYYLQTEKKIAHRDIKPDNIMFDKNNNIMLCDFSESFYEDTLTSESLCTFVGTPNYMSPQIKEYFLDKKSNTIEYNPYKSDVYSLGIVFLDLATLTVHDENDDLKERILEVNERYGNDLTNLINIMLEKNENLRPDFKSLPESRQYQIFFKNTSLKEIKEYPSKSFSLNLHELMIQTLLNCKENPDDEVNEENILVLIQQINKLTNNLKQEKDMIKEKE